jgi:hypothetical protein
MSRSTQTVGKGSLPHRLFIGCGLFALVTIRCTWSAEDSSPKKWPRGPSTDPSFFPLAVWLQAPANAERYRRAGFNTYVGLWQGPTEAQLAELKKAGMHVICEQNEIALRHLDDSTIIGWMHGDEPDNAQSLGARLGWSAPIKPEKIVEAYSRINAKDSSRPIMLNLGQGVAWDGWYGRGTRKNHPEDYPKYLQGCDIASFDIYPVVQKDKEVAGNLWYVARGVERLVKWSGGEKAVWNCLECTHIENADRKATPHQVRCEAWMSLNHGSQGLIYFVHQFKPVFREPALLDDQEMLAAVTTLNRQITALAPALNRPSVTNAATVISENAAVPLAIMVKQFGGATYLFAVAMREGATTATFNIKGAEGEKKVEVIDEGRTLSCVNGSFKDSFSSWDTHLYRLPP